MSSVSSLLAKQRELMKHEKIFEDLLSYLKAQQNRLQIEHLQLESILAKYNKTNTEETSAQSKPLQKAIDLNSVEEVNSQEIDLTIDESLQRVLSGNISFETFLQEEEVEEEEEEEDEGDEGISDSEQLLTFPL